MKQHLEEYIPSDENQDCLKLMKNQITVERLSQSGFCHCDIDITKVPLDKPVLCMEWYELAAGKKEEFQRLLEHDEDQAKLATGGWGIPGGTRFEEYMVFTGVDSEDDPRVHALNARWASSELVRESYIDFLVLMDL